FSVRTKADRTPVSEVDEAVEKAIRERLDRERPGDAIIGEEFGERGDSPRRWIIDPIDATKNYIRGIPVFATLIALDGRLGVVSAPALNRRWWAMRGEGAMCDGTPIRVSTVKRFEDAQIGYDSLLDFDAAGIGGRFVSLLRRCGRSRAFGDFWTHMLVAEGATEIAIEPKVAWWDMAAVQLIVEEAGGKFTTLDGRARADGGSAVSTNGLLHDEVLAALR
ncbi:MAG TPA: inositol monophosphatase family protein, partial [Thermoanaerobaculia bacterium]|nr:inositol monophosphatase family protein [Thermoanaerobaculia bacterium]